MAQPFNCFRRLEIIESKSGVERERQALNGAIHHTYAYQGWRVRAAFLGVDGPAVRMEYSKIIKVDINGVIQDYELQAIMNANTRTCQK